MIEKTLKKLFPRLYDTQRYSWIAHTFVAVLIPLGLVLLIPGLDQLWNGVAFPILVTLGAAFYIRREILDEKKHRSQGSWGDETRRDQIGDALGPITGMVAAWASWLLAVL